MVNFAFFELQHLMFQHHMLGPVQRVPRYRLLLEDYVKKLPEDAVDRQEAEMALCLITKAATHSNETMKKIVSIQYCWFNKWLLGDD